MNNIYDGFLLLVANDILKHVEKKQKKTTKTVVCSVTFCGKMCRG